MKILITGGTGLIGSRLIERLGDRHMINVLTRSLRANTEKVHYYKWNPDKHIMDESALHDIDVIINLAGAGIADKNWNNKRKKLILSSRINSVKTLAKFINKENLKPSVYIGASAVGYYGDRADTRLIESDPSGSGFLADVTVAWEEAHKQMSDLVDRAVIFRIGLVLSTRGGALKEILKPTSLGLYSHFGNGNAYYPWIHIDDICAMIIKSLEDENYKGVYNATAPEPVTNKELVKNIKKAKNGLGLIIPIPIFALNLLMGEMTQLLTNSTRAIPFNMRKQKFEFLFTDTIMAIKDLLEKRI